MDTSVADLLRQFELERLEVNLFRGESRDIGSPQVFGGQVLGQALMAAYATVEGRVVHSLHAYFLRRGDFNAPIVYHVDRGRDGGSISARRVVAVQHGEQIFNLAASFQCELPGLEHQSTMPQVPPPEELADSRQLDPEVLARLPEKLRRVAFLSAPFEFRPVEQIDFLRPTRMAPVQHLWLRARSAVPDNDALHRCLLAYVSDFNLLGTSTLPHGMAWLSGEVRLASIDHAMWFHRAPRVDDWLLYAMDSPSASGARGFSRGSIFTRDGRLIASVAQEGMIRVVTRPAG